MSFTGKLKAFQEDAVDRMVDEQTLLVAYEMGLGKTVLSIAAMEWLVDNGDADNCIIVAPASLKRQWEREISKFSDDAAVLVVVGDPRQRMETYRRAKTGRYRYVVLNYEQVLNDWEIVKHLPRDVIVADEITAIKNPRAKRTRRMRRFDATYKWGLTGQPVENRPEEAFSIMQWVDPDVLGRYDIFDKTFVVRASWGAVKRYQNLPLLHKRLGQAMARCTRIEVADQLPRVGEELLLVDFDAAGARLYRKIAKDLSDDLTQAMSMFGGKFDLWRHYHAADDSSNAMRGRIMSKLTCMRMLCDHPDLLRQSAARRMRDSRSGSAYAAALKEQGLLDGLSGAPKLDACMDLVQEILSASGRSKIVLFSFFKGMLALIRSELAAKKIGSVLFTGDMSIDARDRAKQTFESDPACRVFCSSDAGGIGLDLPNANYLISYDLPWSAGKFEQRNARIVRLSSEFDAVTLLSLQMAGSIEERQYQMLEAKQAIASAIVDGKGIDKKGELTLDLATLGTFLRTSEV